MGLISGGRGYESSSAGVSLWHGSGRSGAAIQSGGLFASPRKVRGASVRAWCGSWSGGVVTGMGSRRVLKTKMWPGAATESCNRPESFPESDAGSPFLSGGSTALGVVGPMRDRSHSQPGWQATSFPNSRIRPSIAVPVNADLTEPTWLDDASGYRTGGTPIVCGPDSADMT